MSFTSPWWLLGLLLVPALLVFALAVDKRRSRYPVTFTNLDLLAGLVQERRMWRRWIPLALLILLGGALLAALYLLEPVWMAYFHPPAAGGPGPRRPEAPLSMLVPVLIAAFLNILLGLAAALPGLPLSLAERAAAAFFGPG